MLEALLAGCEDEAAQPRDGDEVLAYPTRQPNVFQVGLGSVAGPSGKIMARVGFQTA